MNDAQQRQPRQATVTGGTFSGVTTVGQDNEVHVRSVRINTGEADALAELTRLVDALTAELATGDHDANRAVAHEQASQLAAELTETQPAANRVKRVWARLRSTLDVVKVGVDVARIAEAIAHLFGA